MVSERDDGGGGNGPGRWAGSSVFIAACSGGRSLHRCCSARCPVSSRRNTVEMRRLPANEKRRIRSETEILAELQHPHIINFYHVWENKEKGQ